MKPTDLNVIGGDVTQILEALNAGDVGSAYRVCENLAEYLIAMKRAAEAPRYTSYAQNKLLAVLTGYSIYPPKYWQELEVTKEEAQDFINGLKLEGEAILRDKTYYSMQTEQKEKNYRTRRRIAA